MRRRADGFTLMEVLLATALLAAALTLGFGILRAAAATVTRGELRAQRSEHIRAVSEFLRARLSGAQPMVFGFDAGSGRALRFVGDAGGLRFVAEQPAYVEAGGPALHVLQWRKTTQAGLLSIQFQPLQAGTALPAARAPEPLAEALQQVEFAYRGVAADGQSTAWLPAWTDTETLPWQLRLRIRDAQGAWPELVVELPLAKRGSGT